MKVLLVTGEYPPMRGGVADYSSILGRSLVAAGCSVSVLTSTRATTSESDYYKDSSPHAVAVQPVVAGWGREVWRRVVEVVERERPDVVHLQYQTGAYGMRLGINLVPWLIRWKGPRPRVLVTFHDLKEPYVLPKIGRLRHLATAAIASGADAVVVTNHEDYRRIASTALPKRTRPILGRRLLAAIPIGSNILRLPVDYDRAVWRGHLGAHPDEIVVGYFGFLVPSKGLESLSAAFEALIASKRPVRLAMIGAPAGDTELSGDSYAAEIRQRLARIDREGRVCWTGFAPEEAVAGFLRACDVVCLPFREGASLRHGTLAAAIVQGLPIVTTRGQAVTDASGLPVLRDGDNALVVPPDRADDLTRALARLVDNPSLRDRLRNGVAEIAGHFDWQKIACQHVDLYESLTAN